MDLLSLEIACWIIDETQRTYAELLKHKWLLWNVLNSTIASLFDSQSYVFPWIYISDQCKLVSQI